MSASELFKAGKLREAVEAQTKEVKANPADKARRLFLFELLAFTGDLDRAGRQAEALTYEEPELLTAVLTYRKLVESERERRKLFADGVAPRFLGEPPDHAKLRLEAVNRLRENKPAEAAELLAAAAAAAPNLRGTLNGKALDGLRDCDDLFGTVLEVMAQGTYLWVPLEQVESLALNAPQYPRDLIWMPARLETTTLTGEVFLPALYPGSHEHADEAVQLGRATEWRTPEGGPVLGVGARLFLAGGDAVPLTEFRQLQLEQP